MSNAEWEEVKKLAADFQRAQLSSTLQKLSERNCVEIISKLIESNLLNVIFTNDGKEYITPQHLEKEIKDELYCNGGRINLVVLAERLNVDLSHVSKIVGEIERHNKEYKLILGQLIDHNYLNKIAEEINDKLSQQGYTHVAELTLVYDLPADFLQSLIEKNLGTGIHGKQDSQDRRVFYTEAFIQRNKGKIRGALSAITRPTLLSAVLGQCAVPEKIFFLILESLQEMKHVPGIIPGKQGGNSIYVPTIYSKSQNEWVNGFFKQNGYLEYDALIRLGITDPSNFVKRHFSQESMHHLDSVAVGSAILDQIDAHLEGVCATESFLDVYPFLPSVFTERDVEILLQELMKKRKYDATVFAKTVVASNTYLQKLHKSFEPRAEKKAQEAVDSGKWLQFVAESKIREKTEDLVSETKTNRKEERRKKANMGKPGGGFQGKETKTKSTKKKYLHGRFEKNDSDGDDDDYSNDKHKKHDIGLMTLDDLKKDISMDPNVSAIDKLADEFALYLQPELNKYAMSVAEKISQRHKIMSFHEIEERLNLSMTNIKMFDKGIKHLDKLDQITLTKYLLKSFCLDLANDVTKVASQQNNLQTPENFTSETRQKIVSKLPKEVKDPLNNLLETINRDSLDEFYTAADRAMASCGLIFKKYDKKKERIAVLDHKHALLEKLSSTRDPSLALHLVTSIVFTRVTQCAIHMSGRHISAILSTLQTQLDPSVKTTLSNYHDLVIKYLSSSDASAKSMTLQELENGLEEIKKIANDLGNNSR